MYYIYNYNITIYNSTLNGSGSKMSPCPLVSLSTLVSAYSV